MYLVHHKRLLLKHATFISEVSFITSNVSFVFIFERMNLFKLGILTENFIAFKLFIELFPLKIIINLLLMPICNNTAAL